VQESANKEENYMTDRIRDLKDKFIKAQRKVDVQRAVIITESYKRNIAKSEVMKRALALKDILENIDIEVRDQELLVGNQAKERRAVPLFPEYATDWLSTQMDDFMDRKGDRFCITEEQKETIYQVLEFWRGKSLRDRVMESVPESIIAPFKMGIISNENYTMSAPGHIAPYYEYLLRTGFDGVIERCQQKLEELIDTDFDYIDKLTFYEACIVSCEAIKLFAKRYARIALDKAGKETNPKRREELLEIAENCERVPAKPAKTYWQALQFIYFVQITAQLEGNGLGIVPGRLDQTLAPYYENDIKTGILNRDSALELMECFFLKLSETDKVYSNEATRFLQGPAHGQCITVGGVDRNGWDATTEVSFIILDADYDVRLVQPDIAVRIHSGTPSSLLSRATRNVKAGINKVKIFNDVVVTAGVLGIGVPFSDAWNFSFIGCSEPLVDGKTNSGGNCGHINLAKCLELALNNGVCMLTGKQMGPKTGDATTFGCFEDIKNAYAKQVAYFTRCLAVFDNILGKFQAIYAPLPFYSSIIWDCIGNGIEFNAGGAVYNTTSPLAVGPITTGDSLTASKKTIFEDKTISIEELIEALRTDFSGKENVRQLLLNRAPKFGNDIDEADLMCCYVVNQFCDELDKYINNRGGKFIAGVYYLTSNIPNGERTAASADGRKAHMPLNDGGVSPTHGVEKRGATAVLKSAGKLNNMRMGHGCVLNQRFHPSIFEGNESESTFNAYMKGIVDVGAWESQFNVITSEALHDAQENPDKYAGLVVRVAGYSAYFTALEKELQDEIIDRTEMAQF
jgi:formate C-acetyltransferase